MGSNLHGAQLQTSQVNSACSRDNQLSRSDYPGPNGRKSQFNPASFKVIEE